MVQPPSPSPPFSQHHLIRKANFLNPNIQHCMDSTLSQYTKWDLSSFKPCHKGFLSSIGRTFDCIICRERARRIDAFSNLLAFAWLYSQEQCQEAWKSALQSNYWSPEFKKICILSKLMWLQFLMCMKPPSVIPIVNCASLRIWELEDL